MRRKACACTARIPRQNQVGAGYANYAHKQRTNGALLVGGQFRAKLSIYVSAPQQVANADECKEKYMGENEEKMNEVKWTEKIRDMLNKRFETSNPALHAETQVELPYSIMFPGFGKDGKLLPPEVNTFKTDLLICEEKDGKRIPRVVMEAKFRHYTTHDAMTYGKKAVLHRSLMPYLRYGLMLGAMEDKKLTWRLFEHGGDFDSMFAFKAETPGNDERARFIALVEAEIANSQKLEEMFASKNEKSDIYCVQKNVEFESRP